MWYFSWVLGLSAALLFGILNAMWFEMNHSSSEKERSGALS